MSRYHVLTFGESMMRLTPPGFLRIEQTRSFDIWVGGTESNTAVGLARLGMKAAWLSRLPATPMGRYISNRIAQYGVDVSHVVWANEDERLGIYFHEKAQPPRASEIVYDRKDSAMSRIRPEDLPAGLFEAGVADVFHVTGITLAISGTARETAHEALRRAKSAGWRTSFDTNYRSKLWSGEDAAAGCDAAMSLADVIFCPLGDFQVMYGAATAEEAIAALAARYPSALIVMTLGQGGAQARKSTGSILRQPAILAGEVGRIGGGDAFAAGFLYAWLSFDDVELALKWGVAMSAQKYTIPGDLPLVDREAVAALVAGASGGGLIR
ncbi:MAG: sugar kinase [Chloroflexota bacterium]|nr:sugar kinase [Chloroflexota bacterium]MDE2946987.1 sugar kinase [Chloroflexota bacterium]